MLPNIHVYAFIATLVFTVQAEQTILSKFDQLFKETGWDRNVSEQISLFYEGKKRSEIVDDLRKNGFEVTETTDRGREFFFSNYKKTKLWPPGELEYRVIVYKLGEREYRINAYIYVHTI